MTALSRKKIIVVALALGPVAFALGFGTGPVTAQQPPPNVQRKVLLTQELAGMPGYQMVVATAEIPPGGPSLNCRSRRILWCRYCS